MPNPITVPQRRPSTPAQVQGSAARYAANAGGVLGQSYFSELHPDLQKKITGQFGIPQTEWDNTNSYYANLLRLQLGAANKDSDNMRFQTYASDYKRFAGVPQKTKALDDNIGWDRKNQRWLPHKGDITDPLGAASQGGKPSFPSAQEAGRSAGTVAADNSAVPPSERTANPSANVPQGNPTVGPSAPSQRPAAPSPQAVAPTQVKPATRPSAVPPVSSPSGSGIELQRVKSSVKPAVKQGAAMDDKQMFKVAFLAKCIDEGLNLDEIKTRVKQALYFAEKRALDGPITNIIGQLGSIPLVGLAGLTAVGAGGYYLGNQVVGPGLHNVTKSPIPSREEMLNEELTNEYDRQATLIKRQTEMAKRRRERDRGISGVTRY
jgi:hypothetical protein